VSELVQASVTFATSSMAESRTPRIVSKKPLPFSLLIA
jgi:hypothetical protein